MVLRILVDSFMSPAVVSDSLFGSRLACSPPSAEEAVKIPKAVPKKRTIEMRPDYQVSAELLSWPISIPGWLCFLMVLTQADTAQSRSQPYPWPLDL